MNRTRLLLLIAVCVVGAALVCPAVAAPQAAKKIPVILDTDIGGDIDDTWALIMLLNSPELDLKLVTTATGNTPARAKIAAKLLEVAKRTDIPVGIGIHEKDGELRQGPWVEDYDLSKYPGKVYQDGVDAMIKTIMASKERITLIAIGPLPNVAAALEREPRIAERVRFVGMQGSVRHGYRGGPEPEAEFNVSENPKACRTAFTAPWDATITPLDTCGVVRLDPERYAKVAASPDPLVRSLIANWMIWYRATLPAESSTLYDTVAIYLAFTDELLKMERVGIRVTDDGMTVEDKEAKQINCALDWKDKPAFLDLIVNRVTSAAYAKRK